jgi:acetyl-CoA synthetase
LASFQDFGPIVWRPSPDFVAQSHLTAFMARHGLSSLDELQRRSVNDLDWFWNAVLEDLDIRFTRPYTQIVDLSRGPAWARWCVGGEMNIVDNLLDRYAGTPTDAKTAIRSEGEPPDGVPRALTYAELRREVNRAAGLLRAHGVSRGDVVGVLMPMTPECVIAMLAIIKVGAIFLPLFSGYGVEAVAQRLEDSGAVALMTSEGFTRRGRRIDLRTTAESAAARVPGVRHVLLPNWSGYPDEAETTRTGADETMMLIYTSGTSGRPKGTVHSHCGFPIKAAQDMAHGFDLHADETMCWITDIGWMMGPWLVFGTLLSGAAMMLYDGALDWPGPDRLWELVARHRITTLGISPTLVRALMQHGEAPVRAHDLSSLRKFGSTGEPWNPDPWRWLFDVVGGGRLPIINYSGGTETSGGIVGGNVLTPLKACAFAGPLPGMAAEVVDDQGRPVRGEVGELVVTQPWIGMTRGFWRDPDRYIETYWSRWPDVWAHGDWAAVDEDGLWYILGRSDDTIKVAGKRLGPAEAESILVAHPGVVEAAAIGVPDDLKGEALVCFCVLAPTLVPSDDLRDELAATLVAALGKPFAPKAIRFVDALPKTRNAKIMRRLVRSAYLGEAAGDISSLENPAAVDAIRASR